LRRREWLYQRHVDQCLRPLRHPLFACPQIWSRVWSRVLAYAFGASGSCAVSACAAPGAEPPRADAAMVMNGLRPKVPTAVLAGEVLPCPASTGRAWRLCVGPAVAGRLRRVL
jgi:hypothetical protein